MTGSQRATRLQPLQEVGEAACELAQLGGIGKPKLVFQNVAQVLLVSTALVSATIGLLHLWKELHAHERRRHQAQHPSPARHGHDNGCG